MNKALLQLIRPHLLLLTLCLSTYVSAESYDTNEYIGLDNAICKTQANI